MAQGISILQVILSSICIFGLYLIWFYFTSPLKSIPGPFLAKFTNFWRLIDTYNGRAELTHKFLHEKYGQAVRIGPNLVSLNDPDLVRTIYSLKGEFLKSDFYTVNDSKVGSITIKTVFGIQTNDVHSQMLRPVQKLYKMGHILTLEPLVDNTINNLFRRLDESFVNGPNAGKTCKIDDWMVFFAWDVIGQVTFSRSMGFLDAAYDHSGYLDVSNQINDYFGVIGQLPALDHWLAKNPVWPIGPLTVDKAAAYCAEQSIARQKGTDSKYIDQKDMLDDFLELKRLNPGMVNDNTVIGYMLVNILAGADTTSIAIRSIIYFTLKNPRVYKKLQQEIDNANLSLPVAYKDAAKLPYLEAVVRESSRCFPGVGLLLERVVPASGLTLPDGTFLPPGTNVGMSAWTVHQSKKVFGEDAGYFVPERWLRYEDLETQEEYESRRSAMRSADLSFGAGKRICLGRNISILEIYKLIPSLFLNYDISLVNPRKEWKVQNSWFVRQSDIDVRIQKRNSAAV
ncbi:benzoate 4-monooxygenase cytochrome p450 [Botrytis cinerea]